MRGLFVTGGTGFVGRRLLRALDAGEYRQVICLSRPGSRSPAGTATGNRTIRFIDGDLRNSDSYTRHLAGCDTVLHLAAATGRAPRADAFSINADGTRVLAQECLRHGVRDFLFVSTIAVNYPETGGYPYAESKRLAERAVQESGLRYAIVRPTIVMAPEAPIWRTIAGLASRRVIVMPGRGRARVQPIFVDDFIGYVIALLRQDLFRQSVFELGGPEVASFDEFLRRVHRLRTGREPVVLHLPLGPIAGVLSVLEPLLGRALPVTAGQLFAFRYDSTADPHRVLPETSIRALGLDAMIRKCFADG